MTCVDSTPRESLPGSSALAPTPCPQSSQCLESEAQQYCLGSSSVLEYALQNILAARSRAVCHHLPLEQPCAGSHKGFGVSHFSEAPAHLRGTEAGPQGARPGRQTPASAAARHSSVHLATRGDAFPDRWGRTCRLPAWRIPSSARRNPRPAFPAGGLPDFLGVQLSLLPTNTWHGGAPPCTPHRPRE